MHQTNHIVMKASKARIFEAAANLEIWPTFLPHYRYIRYLERSPTRNIVKMAAVRDFIPISWESEQLIDRDRWQVRFNHLKAWTKGMQVVWEFAEFSEGIRVEILHDFRFRVPALSGIADPIIGGFFIDHIANQTLKHMKTYVENL